MEWRKAGKVEKNVKNLMDYDYIAAPDDAELCDHEENAMEISVWSVFTDSF